MSRKSKVTLLDRIDDLCRKFGILGRASRSEFGRGAGGLAIASKAGRS